MSKAVFLDRDGTINVEKHYIHKIKDFEFLPGVVEGLKKLQKAGYLLIIITNQSGIGRGYYTEKDFAIISDWMLNKLEMQDVKISGIYYCPHLPDAIVGKYRITCDCRKPALGLYHQAIIDYDIDICKSWVIGDRIRDCSICEKTACGGYLISNNEEQQIIERVKRGEYKNVKYALDLFDAANKIVEGKS